MYTYNVHIHIYTYIHTYIFFPAICYLLSWDPAVHHLVHGYQLIRGVAVSIGADLRQAQRCHGKSPNKTRTAGKKKLMTWETSIYDI